MAAIVSALTACGQSSYRDVDVRTFEKLIQESPGKVLLDVRTPEEFNEGHIPGAINIDYNAGGFAEQVTAAIPAGSHVDVYCRSGRRSAEAAKIMAEKGYEVCNLEGGILDWQKNLLPLTDGKFDFYIGKSGKSIRIEPLIHASLRITFDGKEIEIDPVGTLGNRHTDYSQFPKADIVMVTHEHHDHLDPTAIKTLMKSDTVVIANPNSAGILGFGEVMTNGDEKVIEGIDIKAVPAYNTTPGRDQFHPEGRDNGYILTLDGVRLYIAGDTEVIPEMKQLGAIDIAFLPCNQPYTMTPDQFIEAAEIIKPNVVYPYHFGDTDLSPLTPALAPLGIYVRICPFD